MAGTTWEPRPAVAGAACYRSIAKYREGIVRVSIVMLAAWVFAALALGGVADGWADQPDDEDLQVDKDKPGSSPYVAGAKAVKAEDYAGAIPLLSQAVAADPGNADAYNLLGYSHRKLGRLDAALGFYQTALTLAPEHRDANEYLGELYLKMNNLKAAEGRLAVLDRVCPSSCEEFEELRDKIAAYRKGQRG